MKLLKIRLQLYYEVNEVADMMFAENMEEVEKMETAFALMEDVEFNLDAHLQTFDPKEFVENIGSLGTVNEAKWLPQSQIEYIVEFDETCQYCTVKTDDDIIKHATDALLDESLEDGEYESCEENGWIIKTKPLADGSVYEYGLVDYRNRKNISVEIIPEI